MCRLRTSPASHVLLSEDFGEFLFKHVVAKVDVDDVALAVKKDVGRDALDVVSLRAMTLTLSMPPLPSMFL